MGRHPGKPPSGKRLFARWSFIIALSLALFLVVGVSTLRETYGDWKVDHEIQDLQTQVSSLQGRKLEIGSLLDRLNSAEVLDKEARVRLGMQKPGEKVIIVRSPDANSPNDPQAAALELSSTANPDQRSNPQKWFAYFITR